MRRLVPLALAAVVLLSGCGTERPDRLREADATISPAPSPSDPPTTPAPTGPGSLADFPLALGLPDRNGDDQSPVVVRGVPATDAFELCGRTVWDPHAGTTEVIGVEWSAEAEWYRGRTLVLYASVEAAAAAVDHARYALMSCPVGHGGDDGHPTHSELSYDAGDQSLGWIDRYWSAEVDGYDTGLTVYHEVRVGRAVLFTYEYGEANGSPQTMHRAIDRAERQDQPLVDLMKEL